MQLLYALLANAATGELALLRHALIVCVHDVTKAQPSIAQVRCIVLAVL
jgi:hypothetical protein